MAVETLTIRRPDDWHVHLRDGAMLKAVLPFTARQFARAIVMPNLASPITTVAAAEAYRARIMAALPPGADFISDSDFSRLWSRSPLGVLSGLARSRIRPDLLPAMSGNRLRRSLSNVRRHQARLASQ